MNAGETLLSFKMHSVAIAPQVTFRCEALIPVLPEGNAEAKRAGSELSTKQLAADLAAKSSNERGHHSQFVLI